METQGERREERGQKEEADEEDARKRRCTRTRLVCGGNISTEINQGCTQISKRKITKINRPDVQRDKKALPCSSFSHFSLFFLFPLSLSPSLFVSSRYPSLRFLLLLLLAKVPAKTRPSMDTKRPTARQNSRGVYINYTDRTHKISMNKPGTSLIAPHAA